MNVVLSFASLVERLGWVLVNSLWQFAVAAILAALALGLMRRASAAARYRLLLVALAAIVAAPLATWFVLADESPLAVASEGPSIDPQNFAVVELPKETASAAATAPAVPANATASWRDDFERLCRPWLGAIVAAWCLGVGVFALRPLLGLRTLRRLRTIGLSPLPESLQERFAALSRRLLNGRGVRIAQSAIASSPLTLGGLRPMILLPLGIVSELPLAQLEAILAHELAHIRRHDFFVNLAQTLIETIFFYHPAVWWLSRRLRLEREHCCDDAAVQATGDRAAYGRALLALEELRAEPGLLALGARSGSLAARIERLSGKAASPAPQAFAVAACAVVLLLGVALTASVWGFTPDQPIATADEDSKNADQNTDSNPASTSFSGQVVDVDGDSVADIEIEACAREGEVYARARSDATGTFVVELPKRRVDQYGSDAIHLVAVDGERRVGWVSHKPQDASSNSAPCKIALLDRDAVARGRIVDSSGAPVRKLRVQASALHDSANSHIWLFGESPLPSAITDDEGRYELRVPSKSLRRLTIDHPDWARSDLIVAPEPNAEAGSPPIELPTMTIVRGGQVTGRIFDAASGKALAGMIVTARGLTSEGAIGGFGHAETDADGRYAIHGLKAEFYNVQAIRWPELSPLVSPVMDALEVKAGEAAIRNIDMVEGKLIRGRVTDATSGEPIPRAEVVARVSSTPNEKSIIVNRLVHADDEGRYEVHVPPGICWIQAQKAGFDLHLESERTLDVTKLEALIDVDLQLMHRSIGDGGGIGVDAPVHGGVIRPNRATYLVDLRIDSPKPIGHYVVRYVYEGSDHISQESYPSGPKYEATFGAEDVGKRVRLLFDVPGFAPVSKEFAIGYAASPIVVDLKPAEYAPIHGSVVDKDGAPLADARIRVRRFFHGKSSEFPWGVETTTDKDGRYELTHLRVGERVTVHASKAGIGESETEAFSIEKKKAIELPKLTLGAADATVAGTVTDQDGLPVSNAVVSFNGVPSRETTTNAEGKFRLSDLPPGALKLTLRAPDGAVAERRVDSPNDGAKISIYLESLDRDLRFFLPITVKASDGQPVVQGKCYLLDLTDRRLSGWRNVWKDGMSHLDMRQALRAHPDHHYGVAVVAENCAVSPIVELVTKPTPQPATVELTRAPMAKVSGCVVDENNVPLAGVHVDLTLHLGDVSLKNILDIRRAAPRDLQTTGRDGRFEVFVHRGAGVDFYVNQPGRAGAHSERIVVGESGDVRLPYIRLPLSRRKVTGRITTIKGNPIAGAEARTGGISPISATSNERGEFELVGAPDGKLIVVAVANGYKDVTAALAPDANALDFRLPLDDQLERGPTQPDPYHLAR